MNILLVEDEPLIAKRIQSIFKRLKVVNLVTITETFDESLNEILSNAYDILLIDIHLGNEQFNGIDLCKAARRKNARTPIIVITANYSMDCLEEAFRLNVNDYITKPFHPKELELRVERWFGFRDQLPAQKIVYEEMVYELRRNQFFYKGDLLNLTKMDKRLLALFIKSPETLLSKDYLEHRLWGDHDLFERRRNIRSNIQLLRKSLGPGCGQWLRTIRGEGYLFKKP